MAITPKPPCLVLNPTSNGNDDSLNDRISLPINVHSTLSSLECCIDLAICLYIEEDLDSVVFDIRLPYGGFVTIFRGLEVADVLILEDFRGLSNGCVLKEPT